MRKHVATQLLKFVRMAIWGRAEDSAALTDAEWKAVLDEAKRQSVQGLVCEAVSQLDKALMPPVALRITLLAESDAVQKRSAHVEKVAEQLTAAFSGHGLNPVIQKGTSVACFYPNPHARRSGDVDLYFPEAEFESARKMAENAGVTVNDAPDGSINYIWNDVTVEHHRRYYDCLASFEDVPVPSAEATMLLLSSHILKHAIGVGIGLKQFCDIALACRALDGQYDAASYLTHLRAAGMMRWERMLETFLEEYMGVERRYLPALSAGMKRLDASRLLAIVLEGGNFGHYNPARHLDAPQQRRKRNTFLFFVKRAPFALRVSPREWFHTVGCLVHGNLSH